MSTCLKYKIGLNLIPKIGCINAKKLVAYCGSAEAIFKENKRTLLKIPGIGSSIANQIINQNIIRLAEKEIEFIKKNNIKTFFFTDKEYPARLKHCVDSPIMLFYKGTSNLNSEKIIGIVGTRNASDYGKTFCYELTKKISSHKPLVVSGLAYGIDICAHKVALENNLETIGVLAHGLDQLYPSLHKETAQKMKESGGLLTEFISKTTPNRENFPQRNRIIAGLVDAIIVLESDIKGGAIITAEIANSYNRDVFALPGRYSDKYSAGCNLLIKTNRAALIEKATDIEKMLNWDVKNENKKNQQKKLFIELNNEEKIIVEILKKNIELSIDAISMQAAMPMSIVSAILLNLEFKDVVKSMPGKRYKLLEC